MVDSMSLLDAAASGAVVGVLGAAMFWLRRVLFGRPRKATRQVERQEPRLFRDADDFTIIEWTEDRRR